MCAVGESCANVNVSTLTPNYELSFRETLYSTDMSVVGRQVIQPPVYTPREFRT
jgi:hypothetical protein